MSEQELKEQMHHAIVTGLSDTRHLLCASVAIQYAERKSLQDQIKMVDDIQSLLNLGESLTGMPAFSILYIKDDITERLANLSSPPPNNKSKGK